MRHNLRLVVTVAKKYLYSKEPIEDLVSAGTEGLKAAAEKYEVKHGTKFSTYAFLWVRQSIQRYVQTKAKMIAITACKQEDVLRINKAVDLFAREHGRKPSLPELAEAMGKTVPWIRERLELPFSFSLDAHIRSSEQDDAESPRMEHYIMKFAKTSDPLEQAIANEKIEVVYRAIAKLPNQMRELVELKFGLTGEPPMNNADVGERLGIDTRQVGRKLKEAMEVLRQRLDVNPVNDRLEQWMTASRVLESMIRDGQRITLSAWSKESGISKAILKQPFYAKLRRRAKAANAELESEDQSRRAS